ncbi:hypothetical protein FACS189430_03870 [Bacteroidia bacterium]|nr:hypothetical protein FACS189430_03870 [Bacteroidia bacterium]
MKTLQEFKEWLPKVQETEYEHLEFVWELMKSPYVEYHYSLMTDKKINDDFSRDLWARFDEHRENAAALLFSKLDNNEDTDFHPRIIFCLGKIADSQKIEKERTLAYARKFANADNDSLREHAIIVLGWIGGAKEMPLLGEHLLNDTCAKCRTWSATSFMQMYFRRKSKSLVERALPFLRQAISAEKNLFALGVMIEVVAELTGKKFALPRYAIDNIDEEKILAAKAKAERYFNKLQ